MTLFDIAYDDFKREDTTNTIAITLYTDDKQPITPNASHTWKAKVSKGDKYVGEYPVTISGDTIKLSSSNLTRLPNGDYGLELWETYSGSTTIYPSAGVMEFRVHRNANDTLGTVDPTIDINAIIDDLHKAGQNIKVVATNTLPAGSKASVTQSIANGENQLTFNIPQGHKGEQGNVGPAPTLKIGTVTKLGPDQMPTANLSGGNGSYTLDLGIPQGVQGETNATATQALDIANNVSGKLDGIASNGGGRNLWLNSKSFQNTTTVLPKVDWNTDSDGIRTAHITGTGGFYGKGAQIYANGIEPFAIGDSETFSVEMKGTGTIIIGREGDFTKTVTLTDTWTRYSVSGEVKSANRAHIIYNPHVIYTGRNEDCDAYVRLPMVEKAAIAHDWSPAPEDAPSNDSQLVHKTNNETIAGDKTFVGNTTLAATTILVGNYGLRVTTNGIQKTTDGKTWVPADI